MHSLRRREYSRKKIYDTNSWVVESWTFRIVGRELVRRGKLWTNGNLGREFVRCEYGHTRIEGVNSRGMNIDIQGIRASTHEV